MLVSLAAAPRTPHADSTCKSSTQGLPNRRLFCFRYTIRMNPTFAAMKLAQDDLKERRAIRHRHDIFIRWDIGSGCGCAECEWQRYLGPWYA